ncbi:MAG: hypothetical protein R3261_06955, partial [Alphaproteobacteria bacterium]|nr:hypothetical protein [Alphaproteobacteria bacterium]
MSWNELDQFEKKRAEDRFIGLSAADAIRRRVEEEGRPRRFGFGDILNFVSHPTAEMTPEFQAVLDKNENLRQQLERLLSERVVYQFPKVAAASSGFIDERTGEGFTIRIKNSRAQE